MNFLLLQWAKIVVVLERGFTKKQLLKFQMDYSVKLATPPNMQMGERLEDNVEQRALVVIKNASKTRAKTIKTAFINWKVKDNIFKCNNNNIFSNSYGAMLVE